jgi:hypothetical protein
MHRLPKYVHGYLDRHGKPRHYLRRPGRKKISLPGMLWSTEFMDAYQAAMNQAVPVSIGAKRSMPGTVAEAVAHYLGSTVFSSLAPSTQYLRRTLLERFRIQHGDKRIRKLEPEHVARLLGKLRPHAQRNMRKTLRGLMAFALADGLVDADPTINVKLATAKDTGGFETWPVEHIEQYRAPPSTRHSCSAGTRTALRNHAAAQ